MSQRTFLTPISGVWHGLGLGVLALLLAGVLPADKLGKMPGTPFLPNPQDFPLRFGMFVTKFMRPSGLCDESHRPQVGARGT